MAKYYFEKWSFRYITAENGVVDLSVVSGKKYRRASVSSDGSGFQAGLEAVFTDTRHLFIYPLTTNSSAVSSVAVEGKGTTAPSGSSTTLNCKRFVRRALKEQLLEEVIAEDGLYPDDGIAGGFWYVKVKKVFPEVKWKDGSGALNAIGGAQYKDQSGDLHRIDNAYYKDHQGVVTKIK